MVDWSYCSEVESVPGRVTGNWVFKGTRLPVYALFENLAGETGLYVQQTGRLDAPDITFR